MIRAIWFMKVSAVHVSNISKKRNTSIALEWTKSLAEYLKDNLSRFASQHVSVAIQHIGVLVLL